MLTRIEIDGFKTFEGFGWRPSGRESSQFWQAFFKYGHSSPWLTTVEADGQRRFQILPDGQAGRAHSATNTEATVLSRITSAEFPHLYAIREEIDRYIVIQTS